MSLPESKRALRRYQAEVHSTRRLREIRQSSIHARVNPATVSWLNSPKLKARLKEQPQYCSRCCGNRRKEEGPTIQELVAAYTDEF